MKCNRDDDGDERAGDDSLGMYFREIAPLGVLSAEQELAATRDIATKRGACWASILSYHPLIDPVIHVMGEKGDAARLPRVEIDATRAALEVCSVRTASRQALNDAVQDLVEQMIYADTDGTVMATIRTDLSTLLGGLGREVTLSVPEVLRKCEAFIAYAKRVLADMSALERAKEHFVKSNLRLVVSIARSYRYGPLPLHDLIQEGNIGLIKAIGRFDPRKGFRFSTYGTWWIRHAIGRAIADRGRDVRLPVHLLDRQLKLARARSEFERKHGRPPTDAEVSAILNLSEAKITLADRSSGAVTYLGESISDDGSTLMDLLRDAPERPLPEELDLRDVRAQLLLLLEALTPIEADILRRRCGFDDEMTLKELGVRHSLSRERIRQLQEQALDKLGREIRRRGLLREWKLLMNGETT